MTGFAKGGCEISVSTVDVAWMVMAVISDSGLAKSKHENCGNCLI